MSTPDRVVRTKIPAKVIVFSVVAGLLILGFLGFAFYYTSANLVDARMRGTITAKEFRPFTNPERQITVNRSGAVSTRDAKGEYILTVAVKQRDGTLREFTVWINDSAQFERLNVGDSFDVGPYLVPSSR